MRNDRKKAKVVKMFVESQEGGAMWRGKRDREGRGKKM